MTAKTNIPTLSTRRLTLRAFTEQDVAPLYRVLGEEDVLHYFPNPDPPALDRVQNMIARQLAHWEEHRYGWWAVVSRADPALIGWAGLQFLPETTETEVAYLLSQACWGRGFATEAALASVRYGFETLGLERIVAIAHVDNKASQRVIQKLGMSLVDQVHLWGIESYRYSIDRSSFERRWGSDMAPTRDETPNVPNS